MVIDYLYVISIGSPPAKTYAPLVIDADALFTGSIAFERLEAVASRRGHFSERSGGM